MRDNFYWLLDVPNKSHSPSSGILGLLLVLTYLFSLFCLLPITSTLQLSCLESIICAVPLCKITFRITFKNQAYLPSSLVQMIPSSKTCYLSHHPLAKLVIIFCNLSTTDFFCHVWQSSRHRHTSEILRVRFQTTVIKRIKWLFFISQGM